MPKPPAGLTVPHDERPIKTKRAKKAVVMDFMIAGEEEAYP
jgi:hypothetical protein